MRKPIRIISLIVVIAAIPATIALIASIRSAEARAIPAITLPPTWDEVASALIQSGLGPEALAAAGVSAAETTALVTDAWTHMQANPEAIRNAHLALASAKAERAEMERIVRSGLASQQQVAECASAITDAVSAEDNMSDALAAFFSAATEDLSVAKRNLLTTIKNNQGWETPIEFSTIDLDEGQRIALRDALANERISAELGDDPDQDAQALLGEWRSDITIATAITSLESNLAAVTEAWNQAVGVP